MERLTSQNSLRWWPEKWKTQTAKKKSEKLSGYSTETVMVSSGKGQRQIISAIYCRYRQYIADITIQIPNYIYRQLMFGCLLHSPSAYSVTDNLLNIDSVASVNTPYTCHVMPQWSWTILCYICWCGIREINFVLVQLEISLLYMLVRY